MWSPAFVWDDGDGMPAVVSLSICVLLRSMDMLLLKAQLSLSLSLPHTLSLWLSSSFTLTVPSNQVLEGEDHREGNCEKKIPLGKRGVADGGGGELNAKQGKTVDEFFVHASLGKIIFCLGKNSRKRK